MRHLAHAPSCPIVQPTLGPVPHHLIGHCEHMSLEADDKSM
jgi:hypothetical protein